MHVRRLIVAFAVTLSLTACGGPPAAEPVMPDVVGTTLDVAKSDIERAGFHGDVEVLGGGIFGVVDEKNWQVCKQLPLAGEAIADTPRLEVDRSCDVEGPTPEGTPSAPAPSETAPTPEPSPTPSDEPAETEEPKVETPDDSRASAKAIEKKFKEHLHNNGIKKISAMCDKARTHWACFYDGVRGDSSELWVILTTDGGWSSGELEDMAFTAGLHWFNFIGCDFADLDVIVVQINGLDHNVFRRDTNADALCD